MSFVTPTSTLAIADDMSPDEFFARLPASIKDYYATAIAGFRKPKKTLEEQPLTEKEMWGVMLALCDGHEKAEDALAYVYKGIDANIPILGALCPPENVECKFVEFDNLKVFYHVDMPSLYPQGSYTFYIGNAGCQPSQCIDWYSANIRVMALGLNQRWGECRLLKVPGGAQVEIHYTHHGERQIKPLVFPVLSAEERARYFPQQVRFDDERNIENETNRLQTAYL